MMISNEKSIPLSVLDNVKCAQQIYEAILKIDFKYTAFDLDLSGVDFKLKEKENANQ